MENYKNYKSIFENPWNNHPGDVLRQYFLLYLLNEIGDKSIFEFSEKLYDLENYFREKGLSLGYSPNHSFKRIIDDNLENDLYALWHSNHITIGKETDAEDTYKKIIKIKDRGKNVLEVFKIKENLEKFFEENYNITLEEVKMVFMRGEKK